MQEQKIKESTAILAKRKGMFFIDEYAQPFWKKFENIAVFSLKGSPKGYSSFNMKSSAYSDIVSVKKYYFENERLLLIVSQAKVQRWLREQQGLNVYCMPSEFEEGRWFNNIASCSPPFLGTYEEALEEGLINALNLLEDEKSN